jgi:polyhydroxybutyrate depolymerase
LRIDEMRRRLDMRVWCCLAAVIALAAPLAACGDSDSTTEPSTTPVSNATPTTTTGCSPARSTAAGTSSTKFQWQGAERDVQLTIPPAYDGKEPSPLLLDLHGFGSDGPEQGQRTGFPTDAAARGYIVIEPTGELMMIPERFLDEPRADQFHLHTWWNFLGAQPARFAVNTGKGAVTGNDMGADDIGFLTQLIKSLKEDLCVDSDRVFVAGLSNGAGMSTTMAACALPDVFAAAGPVAGVNINFGCPTPSSDPVPVLAVHALDDSFIPYGGGDLLGLPSDAISVPDRMAAWAKQNGCDPTPSHRQENQWVTVTTWTGCTDDSTTELWSIDDYDHNWPRAQTPEADGHMDASSVLLDFFDTQARS